ncbi:MAG: sulfur carrier protein ThiS [Clostridiales Family XIII bacterium]|jgi:sulfur carrier protein|nr:sulfur carrier protein ThiS [Clostridiales Family XIII bacterium]
MITVNGAAGYDAAGISITAFLEAQGYDTRRIAVGLNETVVPRSEYDSTVLAEGDRVEIVNFVSGG